MESRGELTGRVTDALNSLVAAFPLQPVADQAYFFLPTPDQAWISAFKAEAEKDIGWAKYRGNQLKNRAKIGDIISNAGLLTFVAKCLFAYAHPQGYRSFQDFAEDKRAALSAWGEKMLNHARSMEFGYTLVGDNSAVLKLRQEQAKIILFTQQLHERLETFSRDFTAKRQGIGELNILLVWCHLGLQTALGDKRGDFPLLGRLLDCAYRASGSKKSVDPEAVRRRVLRAIKNMPEFYDPAKQYFQSFLNQ